MLVFLVFLVLLVLSSPLFRLLSLVLLFVLSLYLYGNSAAEYRPDHYILRFSDDIGILNQATFRPLASIAGNTLPPEHSVFIGQTTI